MKPNNVILSYLRVSEAARRPAPSRPSRDIAALRRLRRLERAAHLVEEEVELEQPLLRPGRDALLLAPHERRVRVAHLQGLGLGSGLGLGLGLGSELGVGSGSGSGSGSGLGSGLGLRVSVAHLEGLDARAVPPARVDNGHELRVP